MTSTTELTIVLMGFVMIPAGLYGLLWVWPKTNRSLFRYELWELRDELMGEMLGGGVTPTPAAYALIGEIEGWISMSRVYMAEWGVAMYLIVLHRHRHELDPAPVRGVGHPFNERELLLSFGDRLDTIAGRYVFSNSPAGWALRAVAPRFLRLLARVPARTHRDRPLVSAI